MRENGIAFPRGAVQGYPSAPRKDMDQKPVILNSPSGKDMGSETRHTPSLVKVEWEEEDTHGCCAVVPLSPRERTWNQRPGIPLLPPPPREQKHTCNNVR